MKRSRVRLNVYFYQTLKNTQRECLN